MGLIIYSFFYNTENEIIVINSFGQIILKEQISNETQIDLDTSHLSNGFYFIKVGKQIEKFIKE
ncbi:MAG: T9SS type A sorting domain-containing protein [Bacteroidota bacterium]